MSTLNALLKDVPVEWKALGEIYKFQYGKGNTIPSTGGQYPVYGSNGIVGCHYEYNSEDAPVIGHIGAYAGIVHWAPGKHFVTYNGVICGLINENVLPRYGYYQLIKQDFNSLSKNSSQPFVSYKELNSVIIPVPPLAVQQEIVRVLDGLSEQNKALTTALAQEIDQRKKQYEYYREELFRFEGKKVEWKMVGEYVDYLQPTNYLVSSKNYHDDYKTPVLTAGKTFILGYTDEPTGIFPAAKSPVIIFDDFTTANKWVDFDFKAKSSAMKILIPKDDSKIILKYFYYWLNSCPSELADGDHKRQWISNYSLKLFPIPYPNEPEKSLAIQQEIVRVLDSLSEQNKALTSALAQEIELRNKQYEYYRNLLLSFPN